MSLTTLEISQQEIETLSPDDWKWVDLNPQYVVRLIRKANALGLAGKRIVTIRGYEQVDRPDIRYIDFLCLP